MTTLSPERIPPLASPETIDEKKTRITDIALEALQLRESSGDSLFRSQDKRYNLYDNAVCDTESLSDVTQADPGLRASVMLAAEILFLSSRPASEQDEAANQIESSVDKYLTEHPDWVATTEDKRTARKTELLSGFAEAAEEYNTENATRRSRTRAAATSGFAAVKGAFQNGKARAKNRFSGPEESEEPVSLESLSDEEFTASYDKARKKYAKVVHQDTTRAFLKLRMPGTAKNAKEDFYALQDEFFRRNDKNRNSLAAGSERTVAQVDYIANLQALGEAQRKDKSPLYRSARRFANSKLSAKIATGVATGFALKIAGGALAGVTAGASVGMALDFLAKRARSESEMRRFVIAKSSKNRVIKKRSGEIIKLKAEISADEAESLSAKIITHLKNKKYLNDVEFAGSWLKSVAHRNYSSLKLKNELVKKGINSEIIDQVTAEISGDEHQTETLKKLVAKLKTKTRYQDDLKLKRYLVGRGFSYSLVKEVVDDNEAEVD